MHNYRFWFAGGYVDVRAESADAARERVKTGCVVGLVDSKKDVFVCVSFDAAQVPEELHD